MEGSLPPSDTGPGRPIAAARARRAAAGVLALCVAISLFAPAPAGATVSALPRPRESVPSAVATPAAPSPSGWRAITFGRARFVVPASWPVVDLASDPSACARFDVHAVYLGAQGLQPSCPPGAIGRTEAVQVQPTSPRATAGAVLGSRARLGTEPARIARSAGMSRTITAVLPRLGVVVTATWGTDRELADTVASSFSAAPDPTMTAPPPVDSPAGDNTVVTATPRVAQRVASSTRSAGASGYVGPGFDACTAPSLSSMRAWLSSSYRAIGIYVGGANRACSQANLTSTWVSETEGLGWNLMPLYVGLQAPCTGRSDLRPISSTRAAAQGRNAADDAVEKAGALGLGIGSPIYFDMEAYDRTRTGCDRTVERFLSAWTDELHSQRYVSGVYGSAGSTMAELVAYADSSYSSPDDIWFAHWDEPPTIFGDPYIPDSLWANHQRIHQYSGGHMESHGGVSINIDSSQVDGAVIGQPAEGSFVRTLSGRRYRIAGGAPFPVVSCSALGGCTPIETLSSMRSLRTYPANSTVVSAAETGQTFVAAGGAALPVDVCVANARCSAPIALERTTIASLADGHLRKYPKNGTELTGEPSGAIWRLRNGCRWPRTSSTGAVAISDLAVDAMFPVCQGTLVYSSGRTGRRYLFSLRADGTHRSRLTSGAVEDSAPALSPDGSTVAFTRRVNGNSDVWVMNLDGSGLSRLTSNRAFDGFPSWSPDGASIAFQSDRGGSPDIWTMTAKGTHLVQLTQRRSSERHPAWSPDGSTIAFDGDQDGSFDLWTVPATGGGKIQVTSGRGDDSSPSWSPDGLSIAYQSDRGGSPDIWTIGADGRGRVQLTRRATAERTPTWSPDGGRIAFVSDRDGVPQVFVVHADGTVALRYTSETLAVASPRWSSG